MEDSFLTTGEVLEYLHVNLRTVYRLVKSGRIPAVRVGRQWRFRKADIDAWLEGQRTSWGGRAGPGSPEEPEKPTLPARGGARRRPHVLVVDDEASIRGLLAKTLALADYEVETAVDGSAAVDRLRVAPVDLLVTDLKMPGVDGLALIREARRLYPALPVIIITAYSSEASAIEAINIGVSAYLTKPFRIAKILSSAAQALGE
jgi:excisionase family DNA binding protein